MIKFENVNVKYVEEFFSLFNFSYTFNEHTLIIGDELSGANTVLRLISKFDKLYTGNIVVNDTNIKDIKDKQLDIAFVSKEPYLFNHRSLEYNLSFPLIIRKINKKIIKNTVNNAIFEYNLENFGKKVKNLTISEKKIITLIRAYLRKPKYVLLENFFENLEEKFTPIANKILLDISKNSIIIACEKQEYDIFKNFKIIHINGGVIN